MMKMVGKNFCTNDSSRPKAFNGKGFAFHMRRPQSSSSSSSTWASFSLKTLKKERFTLIKAYLFMLLMYVFFFSERQHYNLFHSFRLIRCLELSLPFTCLFTFGKFWNLLELSFTLNVISGFF